MNIVIIGHVCIDYNLSENTKYIAAGGPAVFINRIYRRFADVNVRVISPYGHDFYNYKAELDLIPIKPDRSKTLSYENISSGNNRQQKACNREYALPLPQDKEIKQTIAAADIIYFAPLTPDYSSRYIVSLMAGAAKKSLKIILPQGYFRKFDKHNNVRQRDFIEAEAVLPFFDLIIVSEQDHYQINQLVGNWSKQIAVIVTLGDQGAQYIDKNKSILQPVRPVKKEEIVDSVGSGDIFSAAYGYSYFLTKNITKSLQFANSIARQCLFSSAAALEFTL